MPSPSSSGGAVRRLEDPALLTGAARFTEDLSAAGALHAVFVRSSWPHARVTGIETSIALDAPGVAGVFTAGDLELGRLGAGDGPEAMRRPVLAGDVVRFQGEAVAVVVAETNAAAVDAAEHVDVDYEPLDLVIDPEEALAGGAPLLFPEHGSNLADEGTEGNGPAAADAEVVVTARLRNQRVAPVPLEPGGALAVPDADGGGVTLWTGCQAPFRVRGTVAELLDLPEDRVRVIAPAIGGAFGGRAATYPEQVVVAALAVRLGRPVRHVATRSETMLATSHGRAQLQDVTLGATREGKLTSIRARVIADCGAYPANAAGMASLTGLMCAGVYRFDQIDFGYRCAVTNTTPIGIYRGAGRPEATALVERAMDLLAARLGIDPAELRRRNVIEAGALPYETPTGASYDSGDYGGALDRVLEAAGYERLRAEQAARRAAGGTRQMGIGLCCYVEWTGFGSERASCSVGANGDVTVVAGTIPQGQGHETAFAQVVFDTLGVPHERVRVVHSDTHRAPGSAGTSGSRTVQVGGSAVLGAARETLEKGRRIAAHLLEADPADLVVVPGSGLGVAGDPGAVLSWAELAQAARSRRKRPPGMPPGLDGESRFATPDATYPFGAHLAVVEVDTETGAVTLARYVAVDDAGRIVDRQRAEGQVHGGIAQGVAQALLEEMAFDADGNCLTGSLVSYCMPSAAELPAFETSLTETPTPRNPLGAKGIGESGTIAATPAVWNAVVDALAHLGVTHVDIPATPQRVWQAIRDGRGAWNPSNTVGP